jgi:hypothetical protein
VLVRAWWGRATRPGKRRASRQAGSANGGGAQGQPAGWQREQKRSAGPAGRLAARAEKEQPGSGQGNAQRRPAGGPAAGSRPATRCSGGRNELQQVRDQDGEREPEMRWSLPGRAGLKMPSHSTYQRYTP